MKRKYTRHVAAPARRSATVVRGDSSAKIVRHDGWLNTLTGLGNVDYDKRLNSSAFYSRAVEKTCEDMYAGDGLGSKIVDIPVEDALRNWFEYTGMKEPAEKALEFVFDQLLFKSKLAEAYRLARIYGGGAIIPICLGGGDLATPLIPEQVIRIESLLIMSRFELTSNGKLVQDVTSPYFGLPESYGLYPRGTVNMTNRRIHHTRVIRIDGAYLPRTLFQQNDYWHDSILNKVNNSLRDYASSFDSSAGLLLDYRQGVLKSAGIGEKVASGNEDAVKNRLRVFDLTRSVLRTMVIDKETEEYQQQTFPLTGVAEVLTKMENRLSAESDIPRTKLFGESASGGLGNEGKSQKKDYQAKISGIQESRLRPAIMSLINLILASRMLPPAIGGAIDKNYGIKFRSLEILDDQETAELRNKQMQTDKGYIESGVVTPEEIAVSRFMGKDGYSLETKVDPNRVMQQQKENDDKVSGDPGAGAATP